MSIYFKRILLKCKEARKYNNKPSEDTLWIQLRLFFELKEEEEEDGIETWERE
jgi:hypothetical protein